MKLPNFSVTMIESFNCLKNGMYKHIDKRTEAWEDKMATTAGKAFHGLLEHMYILGKFNKDFLEENWLKFLNDEVKIAKPKKPYTKNDIDSYELKGREWIINFWKMANEFKFLREPLKLNDKLYIESNGRFKIRINKEYIKEFDTVGVYDLVLKSGDNTVQVYDWKTGKCYDSDERDKLIIVDDENVKPQVIMYDIALRLDDNIRNNNFEPGCHRLIYVEPKLIIEYRISKEHILNFLKNMKNIAKLLCDYSENKDRSLFEARPSFKNCQWCQFKNIDDCPEWKRWNEINFKKKS